MNLTIMQIKQIEELKKEGSHIKQEYLQAREALERAKTQEQEAIKNVLENNIFICADEWGIDGQHKGDRITNPQIDYLINEEVYAKEFLPKLQQAYKALFNIDNPLNFAYVYPFEKNFWSLEKQFLKIATRFLTILGDTDRATQLNISIEGYLKEELKEQLIQINDNFLVD